MRFVPIKTDDQLDLQALHRVRDRLITRRTSVITQQAGYIDADFLFQNFPLAVGRRTIHFGNFSSLPLLPNLAAH
jgi:transposase